VDRRGTSATTLAGLVVLCLLGLLFGLKALSSNLPNDPIVKTPEAGCVDQDITAGTKVLPADVLVSVYNGGTRSGVASKTMSALQIRGFTAGKTDNAKNAGVRRVEVRGDPRNPAVQLVAAQFGPDTRISDQPASPSSSPASNELGVVVVVGDDFQKLGRRVRSVTAQEDTTICSPFK
jgi:hypothetical protein